MAIAAVEKLKPKWTGLPALNPKVRLCTPAEVLDPLRAAFGPVGFDPCGDPHSIVDAAETVFHAEHQGELLQLLGCLPGNDEGVIWGDGLDITWPRDRFVFVNPPYGKLHNEPWGAKIESAGLLAKDLVALVPGAFEIQWFRHYWSAHRICFIDHRLRHLNGAHESGTFGSVLCYWGHRGREFEMSVRHLGKVFAP